MKFKKAFLLASFLFLLCLAYIEYQDSNIRQVTLSMISYNWVSLLSFIFSFLSLWIALGAYRHETHAKIEMETSIIWDLDLEEDTLENGDTTAVVTARTGTGIESILENSGGCATTLKKLKILKRGLLGRSNSTEVEWRRDFLLTQTDRGGALVCLSIWDRIEPGQRVKLLIPYEGLLDVMVTHNMLDLNKNPQGEFILVVKHVYGEAKSSAFQMVLSESLRVFIASRVQTFGRIIVRDGRNEEETEED